MMWLLCCIRSVLTSIWCEYKLDVSLVIAVGDDEYINSNNELYRVKLRSFWPDYGWLPSDPIGISTWWSPECRHLVVVEWNIESSTHTLLELFACCAAKVCDNCERTHVIGRMHGRWLAQDVTLLNALLTTRHLVDQQRNELDRCPCTRTVRDIAVSICIYTAIYNKWFHQFI